MDFDADKSAAYWNGPAGERLVRQLRRQARKNVLEILDASGHLTLSWNPNDPDEVKRAKEEFERLKSCGFGFFREGDEKPVLRVGKSGRLEGRVVSAREFDPEAPRTVATRPLRGG